jgi:Ca-activated chloride channel family protein
MWVFSDVHHAIWILPLCVLWVYAWFKLRPHQKSARVPAVRLSSIQSLRALKPSKKIFLRRATEMLRVLAWMLLCVAMLRPQTGNHQKKVRSEGIDLMLAVDVSGSMRALDLDADTALEQRQNRLGVVKHVVDTFVQARPNDQIGLVVFGQEAYTQCPLTLDHGIVSTFLTSLTVGMAGDGTAIGMGLATAVKRLEASKAKSKVVVLLTDGVNNSGEIGPEQAAELAEALGIKVYTIGAGTQGKAPVVVDTLFGKQVAYEEVHIDEDVLKKVAEKTGGAYFRAEDEKALQAIYKRIDALEKTEASMHRYLDYNDEYPLFIALALGLLLLETVLLSTRLRTLP